MVLLLHSGKYLDLKPIVRISKVEVHDETESANWS